MSLVDTQERGLKIQMNNRKNSRGRERARYATLALVSHLKSWFRISHKRDVTWSCVHDLSCCSLTIIN